MNNKVLKGVAVYLALSILFQVVSPTIAFALTTGPSQPEMQSFEPVGTTQMVDPFTGDFNYNIPLLTVPGPNGGYPINIAYHSGIGMEQEASWVGLGWNISPGVINRQMRGLPDDFNGDVVTKKMNMNPNRTITVGTGVDLEFAGADVAKTGMSLAFGTQFVWNNYKGLGSTHNFGYSAGSNGGSKSYGGGVNISHNTFGGMEMNASLSYSKQTESNTKTFGLGVSHSSLGGIKDINLTASIKRTKRENLTYEGEEFYHDRRVSGAGAGISFASSSFIPHATFPNTGFNLGLDMHLGVSFGTVFAKFLLNGSYTENRLAKNTINFNSFGYMHSEGRSALSSSKNMLMDFNREKDVDLCKDIPSLPVPVFTNDLYVINGQGVGGVFRSYRSDVGILHDPTIESEVNGGSIGMGVGLGIPFQFDTDLQFNLSRTYSGPWQNLASCNDLYMHHQFGESSTDPLYEQTYFRASGDMAVTKDDQYNNVTPGTFPLKTVASLGGLLTLDPDDHSKPLIDFKVELNSILDNLNPGLNLRQQRKARSQFMNYRTARQMRETEGYITNWTSNVYPLNEYPRDGSATTPDYSSSGIRKDDHLGEISVINPDGNRYMYAISAYNKDQKEATFSVTQQANSPARNEKLVPFNTTDASIYNAKNDDHFFSSTEMGGYAHSYLLTAIVSPDYVDLTGNGLSDDDYGYWVKFNYTLANSDYHWKAPYTRASYIKGYNSSPVDDKAGYTYGTKEIWYLTSIETKTHVAEYSLSSRLDGYGADEYADEPTHNVNQALKKLDSISLYSKSDNYYENPNPVPIKRVHFSYNYDLCGNVENNPGYQSTFVSETTSGYPSVSVFQPYSEQPNANSGKLTLKEIWFTHGTNNKGSLSPYSFDYAERNVSGIDLATNPNYDPMQMDRWGNYKPYGVNYNSTAQFRYNRYDGTTQNNPYVDQRKDFDGDGTENLSDETSRSNAVAAWSLRKIVLPSGGEINVEYESDDYAYVQDKEAMQMSKILGFESSGLSSAASLSNKIKGKNWYVYFELEDQSASGDADIYPYVKGIQEIYFKAYEKLTTKDATTNYDYVEGYAEIDSQGSYYGICTVGGKKVGWVKLKKVGVQDVESGNIDYTHPFRKAGWQYLKLNRPDLLYPASNNTSTASFGSAEITQVVNAFTGFVFDNLSMFTGFYNACIAHGYCDEVLLDPSSSNEYRPSFIRTNSPDGIKYGGGHRVKRLTINDTWAESASEDVSSYGQEYIYKLADGRSSGVAEYEPLMGGEEIPHHMPVRYSSPYFILKHKDLYLEKPYGESYYPSANVGYSRVIVKSIQHYDGTELISNEYTKNGISEYEFYTAKDFPVFVTVGNPEQKKFTPKFPLPFIGNISFEDRAFSQQMRVETNDMHGKAKAVASYSAHADLFNTLTGSPKPVTKTEYIYNTENSYSPSTSNQLKNRVDVLFADAYYDEADMGLNKEYFIDMRQESTTGASAGFDLNLYYTPPFVFFCSIFPSINYSESVFKSIVGMEVISRNGILMETVNHNGASTVTSKNLMFDAATGLPLLTTVTNDFDKPVYNYNFAAHWAYEGMRSADRTTGARFPYTSGTGNVITVTGASSYFSVGDELYFHVGGVGDWPEFFVKAVTANTITVEARNLSTVPPGATGGYFVITRSARRNQQMISNGNIVSLSNPVTERSFPLFKKWNDLLLISNVPAGFYFVDCAGNTKYAVWTVTDNVLAFDVQTRVGDVVIESCQTEVDFPEGTVLSSIYSYSLNKYGNSVVASNSSLALYGTWVDPDGCQPECMPDVLHASSSVFKDNWTTELAGVIDDINNNNTDGTTDPDASDITNYPWFYGGKGIWRNSSSYVYQVKRKQSTVTDISKDGTYDNFNFFDWSVNAGNTPWTKTMEVTKYSPYGFELENKDPLNIYSSALYGYNNSLVTAVATNSPYSETAFDGFEDYFNPLTNDHNYSLNKGHGHLNLSYPGGNAIATNFYSSAHTGKHSVAIISGSSISFVTGTTTTNFFRPELLISGTPSSGYKEKKYLISAWFQSNSALTPGSIPSIGVSGGATVVSTSVSQEIEGWKKVDVVFKTTNASTTNITFTFSITGVAAATKLDDVRIIPYQGTIKTYVYDPATLWLKAELDNQNFATFYNYDEEGTLVQVKKETAKGIMTVKTTRSNIKQ